jgi:cell division septal protein FtsQ
MAVEGKPRSRKTKGDQADGFQRRSRPVRVRRGVADWRSWPWRKLATIGVLGVISASVLSALSGYVHTSERFRFPADGSGLAVSGLERLGPKPIQRVFEPDFGKPLAEIDLEARRTELLSLQWVRGATISRIWPDRVWVDVIERQPVAFLRLRSGRRGNTLIDREGAWLDPLPGVQFDLPAVDGIEADMSVAERLKRVQLLEKLIADLDREEPAYGARFGQIDLSDAQNAVATVVHQGEVYQLAMGDKLFRHRFEAFLDGVAGWEKTYGKLAKVDLRFEDKVFGERLQDAPADRRSR